MYGEANLDGKCLPSKRLHGNLAWPPGKILNFKSFEIVC